MYIFILLFFLLNVFLKFLFLHPAWNNDFDSREKRGEGVDEFDFEKSAQFLCFLRFLLFVKSPTRMYLQGKFVLQEYFFYRLSKLAFYLLDYPVIEEKGQINPTTKSSVIMSKSILHEK